MKNLQLITSLFLLISLACSCDKIEEIFGNKEKPVSPHIEIDIPEINFSTDGGVNTISFTTTKEWTAHVITSRADDWCTISPTSGTAGEATMNICTKPNEDLEDRQATIVIEAGTVSESITVSQKQKDALNITVSNFEVDATGGEIEVEIEANIDFECIIEGSAADWIKLSDTRAMNTSSLMFSIAANSDPAMRQGTIFLKSRDIEEQITIYQSGCEPSIVVSQDEYIVSSDGETITVDVTSNVEVSVYIPSSAYWITESSTRATSTCSYKFDIQPNSGYGSRSSEILFYDTKYGISESVKIIQLQKDAIVISNQHFDFDSNGGQIQIEVGHNVDFEIEISDSWISQVTTKAYQTGTIVFNIAKNTTYSNREGTIIFRAKDESISQTISIFQAQEDAVIISEKEIELDEVGGTFSITIQSNVDFTVSEPDVEWLRALTTRGLTDNMLYYEYDANPLYRSRNAQIVVTDIKNNKSETITITQAQKDVIILGQDHFSVESKGGIILIDISSNIDYEICVSDDWVKYLSEKSQESNCKYFGLLPNTDKKDRAGIIKFVSKKDGLLSECVYINQACANGNIEGIDNGDTNDW